MFYFNFLEIKVFQAYCSFIWPSIGSKWNLQVLSFQTYDMRQKPIVQILSLIQKDHEHEPDPDNKIIIYCF